MDYLRDGVDRNNQIATITSHQWGQQVIVITDADSKAAILKNLILENKDSADDELVLTCKAEIIRLIGAYADGSFEALRDYYVSGVSLIDSNVLMNKVEYFRQNPPKSIKVSKPVFTKPIRSSEITATSEVKYTPAWDDELQEYYRNVLAYTLLNELATRSYNEIPKEKLAMMSGQEQATVLDVAVSNLCVAIDTSTNLSAFTVPWAELSKDRLRANIFRDTKVISNTWQMNSTVLQGPQMNKPMWALYRSSPDQLIKEDGYVWYAVFETAVRPKRLSYYGPVAICFYYNPKEKRWRVWRFACHAQISPSVPL